MEASSTTAKQTEKQATQYVVLEQREVSSIEESSEKRTNVFWVECDQITARSAHDAIRTYAKANGVADKGGTFYAVPARSWNPVKVAVETQTRLTLS
jgi:hypothetical protein